MYKIIDSKKIKIPKEIHNKNYKIKESFFYPLTESEKERVSTEVMVDNTNNNIIGYIKIKLDKETIGIVNIYKK